MNDRSKTTDFPLQKDSTAKQGKNEDAIQELAAEHALQHDRLLKQVRAMIPKKSRHRKEQSK
jgi:hypothetical protein